MEFRDYSTYLQKVVRLERKIHEACNMKDYERARRLTSELINEGASLLLWLEENHGS